MVESAAFGVPSVVNCGGNVGAAALLGENEGCIALDLSGLKEEEEEEEVMTEMSDGNDDNEVEMDSDSVKKLLEMIGPRMQTGTDSPQTSRSCGTLTKVAKEARRRALGWDESSCCRGLMAKLNSLKEED